MPEAWQLYPLHDGGCGGSPSAKAAGTAAGTMSLCRSVYVVICESFVQVWVPCILSFVLTLILSFIETFVTVMRWK